MDETAPVDDSEFVYRRIHPRFCHPALAITVLYEAFRPNRNDDTGLSVLRAAFAQPADLLKDVDPAPVGGYAVARLAVCDLAQLGLAVRPDPLAGGPPGHAVIPEFAWDEYQQVKQRLKPILVELAKLASADIALQPSAPQAKIRRQTFQRFLEPFLPAGPDSRPMVGGVSPDGTPVSRATY